MCILVCNGMYDVLTDCRNMLLRVFIFILIHLYDMHACTSRYKLKKGRKEGKKLYSLVKEKGHSDQSFGGESN